MLSSILSNISLGGAVGREQFTREKATSGGTLVLPRQQTWNVNVVGQNPLEWCTS